MVQNTRNKLKSSAKYHFGKWKANGYKTKGFVLATKKKTKTSYFRIIGL